MMRLLFFIPIIIASLCCKGQQNIIIIIADDLGADYCGFTDNASDTAKMPNIRSLLQKGVRFKNAWATPYCSSTRVGALTGRYSFRTGVGTVIGGMNSNDMDTTEKTIASLLKYDAPVQYATANIGKWHMNTQTPQKLLYPTTKFGYDLFQGNFSGAISNYYNWIRITNGIQTDSITNYATTETVDNAIAWLDTLPNNKPFFLWLAFNAPHSPFHLPPANLHSVPGLSGTPQHINQNTSSYFKAMTEAMDTETGRLLQWLSANNKMDSTHIIFMGDNGNDKRVIQIADTTHSKGTLYDYGVHVPMLIAGPAVIAPNRASDALVNVQDVFATALELAGFTNWTNAIPPGHTIDSKSILPILTNQNTSIRDWAFTELFTPVPSSQDGKTIRNQEYQLIRFDNGLQVFYDYAADPLQQTNLLLQNLSATELSAYQYLCNELSTLTGLQGCMAGVGLNHTTDDKFSFEMNASEETLVFNGNAPYDIHLFTSTGVSILRQHIASGLHYINMQHYPRGIYIAEMKTDKQKIVKKIKTD